ncbi:MAG: signal peptidase I [Gaiellaceae bacterium]
MSVNTHDCYRWQPKSSNRSLGKALATVLCAVCLALAGLMLLPGLFGYSRYVITSGSMAGTYDRGSVVFDKTVSVDSLQVGDTITYTPPPGSGPEGMVTHRINWIGGNQFDQRVFRTKGDANESADPWTFSLDSPTQARVAFHVPYVGYIFAALSIQKVRMLVLGLPALLLGIAAVGGLRREARQASLTQGQARQ